MAAVEGADLKLQRHSLARALKIRKMPDVSAMYGRAWRAAVEAPPTILANMGDVDEMTAGADDLVDNAAW